MGLKHVGLRNKVDELLIGHGGFGCMIFLRRRGEATESQITDRGKHAFHFGLPS
jgi:hypothetical protein